MAYIFQSSTAGFTEAVESVRRRISPDVREVLTDEELPDVVIADEAYVLPAELHVLRDLEVDGFSGDTLPDTLALPMGVELERWLTLVALRLAIAFVVQVPQLLRVRADIVSAQNAEIDIEYKVGQLETVYQSLLDASGGSNLVFVGVLGKEELA